MPHPCSNACIFCLRPADLRVGNISILSNGARIHTACKLKLVIELAESMLAPRKGRRTLTFTPHRKT